MMSGNLDMDRLMQSPDVTPSETARQKAREDFLRHAEEAGAPGIPTEPTKSGFRIRINKRLSLSYGICAVAAMLILVGIGAAINPAFLKGTLSSQADVTEYRMFVSGARLPDLGKRQNDTERRYVGEVVLMYASDSLQTEFLAPYLACDGSKISVDADRGALLTSLAKAASFDAAHLTMALPDISARFGQSGLFRYCLSQYGILDLPGVAEKSESIDAQANGLDYIAFHQNSSRLSASAFYSGQIVLFRTTDPNALQETFLPCRGQTVQASAYRELANCLGVASENASFRIPDLTGKSPVAGAEYYVCTTGINAYQVHEGGPAGFSIRNSHS